MTGSSIPPTRNMQPLATPRQRLHRILQNPSNVFARKNRNADVAAMNEIANTTSTVSRETGGHRGTPGGSHA